MTWAAADGRVLLLALLAIIILATLLWPRSQKPRCHVTEEWGGAFVGRRYCHDHRIWWDDGGDCPLGPDA